MNALIELDQQIFLWLNDKNSPFLDPIMIWVTKKYSWVPFYIVLVWFLYRKFSFKSFYLLPLIALLVTASDQISSSILKPATERYRPCHDPLIGYQVHQPYKCGGQYGFVSSHAANTFAVATFFILLFIKTHPKVIYLLLWPLVVSYSRIYLGNHYPGDVIFGGLLGAGLAFLFYRMLIRFFPYFELKA
ncbi:MAG: phosphatase PAP2 family protein [Cyclobacteriaceae bacterium]|nr:phosphatase PAP2 family protein [Cyclobacteriaceae bacterium]MCH8516068.1 phosphatase PAP2 family protein [Cyclobacteriaceae bacterium]